MLQRCWQIRSRPQWSSKKADTNNWGPRVGLAWNPGSGKTVDSCRRRPVLRWLLHQYSRTMWRVQPRTRSVGHSWHPKSWKRIKRSIGPGPSRYRYSSTRGLAFRLSILNLVSPQTYQWNFNIERQLPFEPSSRRSRTLVPGRRASSSIGN